MWRICCSFRGSQVLARALRLPVVPVACALHALCLHVRTAASARLSVLGRTASPMSCGALTILSRLLAAPRCRASRCLPWMRWSAGRCAAMLFLGSHAASTMCRLPTFACPIGLRPGPPLPCKVTFVAGIVGNCSDLVFWLLACQVDLPQPADEDAGGNKGKKICC